VELLYLHIPMYMCTNKDSIFKIGTMLLKDIMPLALAEFEPRSSVFTATIFFIDYLDTN
jgi:hypothetical protein